MLAAASLTGCSSQSESPAPDAEAAEGDQVSFDAGTLSSLATNQTGQSEPLSAALPGLLGLDPASLASMVDPMIDAEGDAFADLFSNLSAEIDESQGPEGFRRQEPENQSGGYGFIGVLQSLFAEIAENATPGQVARGSNTESTTGEKGTGTFGMNLGLGRDESGATVVEFGIKGTGKENGTSNSANFEFNSKTAITSCPDQNGRLELSFDVTVGAEATIGGAITRATTHGVGTVIAQVNDSAYITEIDMDVKIESVKRTDDGRDLYVEVSWAPSLSGGQLGVENTVWGVSDAGGTITRHSSKVRQADVDALFAESSKNISVYALSLLTAAQMRFRDSKCVQVFARAPESVGKDEAVAVDVATRHRLEAVDLTLPVDATLRGAGSIDPSRLPATPASLTYTSGSNDGDSGSVDLVSTSRRGIGRASVTISVAATRYQVSGGGDGLEVSGEVGALDKPFSITGTFPGGTVTFDFSPNDKTSGSVSGALSGSGVTGSVAGDYTITGAPPDPLTLTMTTSGCVDGVSGSCRSNTSEITLTPI